MGKGYLCSIQTNVIADDWSCYEKEEPQAKRLKDLCSMLDYPSDALEGSACDVDLGCWSSSCDPFPKFYEFL